MDTAVQSVQIPGLSVSDVLIQYKRLVLGKDTHKTVIKSQLLKNYE